MSTNKSTCDPAAIEQFLADRLTERDQGALEEHLDECPACRDRLERLAAEPLEWVEARDFLSSADDSPPAQIGSSACERSAAARDEADAARAEHIRAFFSPTDDPRMLGRFGGYEIAGIIGQGGMGVVLKGWDGPLSRYVAIKALAPHLATSAAARLRFAREARAAAAVVHENVIAIHAVSEANGLPYLVMPYLKGMSLQKRLDAQGRLGVVEILRVGRQAAAGLAAAHAQGLVHRDIKPANILLEDGIERLSITDFGLARAADDASLTRSGVIAGTPQFMSPEQARGEAIDQRSDLFSLGSVLYMLCTGRPPFRAETSYGILRRISDDTPRPIRELNPDTPEWLCTIVAKLHAKGAADRYQSADAVAQVFEHCLAHVQQPTLVPLPEELRAPPPHASSPPARVIAPHRQHKVVAGVVSAVVALFVIAIVTSVVRRPAPSTVGHAVHDAAQLSATAPADVRVMPSVTYDSKAGRVSDAASTPATKPVIVPRAPRPSPAARWHDGVDESLDVIARDVLAAEQRANQLWDRRRRSEAPTNDNPSSKALLNKTTSHGQEQIGVQP